MGLREKLIPHLTWCLGNGTSCTALGQPWFAGAMEFKPQNLQQARLLVSDLVEQQTQTWDANRLVQLFGYSKCLQILTSITPPRQGAQEDKLVFQPSNNGAYSVKKGYALLTDSSDGGTAIQCDLWKVIWRKGSVLPRIRLFLWKLLNKALPLGKILARRMCTRDPICATCGVEEEDVDHLLFRCPFSRACWFAGPYPLRSDSLCQGLRGAIQLISTQVTDDQWGLVANSMWSIWRCRNDQAYFATRPSIEKFKTYFHAIQSETMLAMCHKVCQSPRLHDEQIRAKEFKCYSDGSWKDGWGGGSGFALFKDQQLQAYQSAKIEVCCALQAEALALKNAVSYTVDEGIHSCTFYTDSQILATMCTSPKPPTDADWRAFEVLYHVWKVFRGNREYECVYVPRGQNELADYLAKKGREENWVYTGYTFPIFGI